jgi:hypothetical protein
VQGERRPACHAGSAWSSYGPASREGRGTAVCRHCRPLPTFPARWTLQDPRGRAYLVFWRDADGRLLPLRMEQCPEPDAVRISTPDGDWQRLQLVRRPLPRHAGDAVLYHCPSCWRPRRYLYPFAMVGYQLQHRLDVRCQACKGYRWQSQGAYRSALARAIQAALGVVREPYPRHPWDPRAVSDPWLLADEFPELFAVGAREARSARGSAPRGRMSRRASFAAA